MKRLTTTPRHLSVDAVTASVDIDLASLVATLAAYWNGEPRPARPLRGMGYSHAVEIVCNASARRCVVQYSDHHAKPCVTAEGTETFDAPGLYDALQTHYRGLWAPSRADAALDLDHPEAFDLLAGVLVRFALDRGIAIDYRGDWERGKGRTLYLYSRSSQCYVRLYEYRDCHGYGPACRLELEVKMKGRERRLRVAELHPSSWFSLCPATVHVLQLLGMPDQPITVSPGPRPPSSLDKDRAFLAATAWPAFLRLLGHHQGDFEAVFRDVAAYRDETERTRRLLHSATLCDTAPRDDTW